MSKSVNVWSKYADTPAYIVKRERVRDSDSRGTQKREVRIMVEGILQYTSDDESGDDNE